MNVKICNLGAVKEAKIEIKPLTVFIGSNNTGKTWTAYTLAALLGPEGLRNYIRECDLDKFAVTYPNLQVAINQTLEEGNAKIDLVEFADQYAEIYFNDLFRCGKKWIADIIGTNRTAFKDFEIKLRLEDSKASLLERVRFQETQEELSVDRRTKKALISAYKSKNEAFLYFYTGASINDKLPSNAIKRFLIINTLQILHQALYTFIYTFPTERNLFTATRLTKLEKPGRKPSNTASKNLETHRPRKMQSANALFLQLLIESIEANVEQRQERGQKELQIQRYLELAQILENKILAGKLDYSLPESEPGRELLYYPDNNENLPLEMSVSSSMVKELSSLVLYLRFVAEQNELIVIDEPEMNLHPKAQAQIAEFLAMLVTAGLQVMITTHSPYIVDHLDTLIKAASLDSETQEQVKSHFYLQDTAAFIKKEDVSAFLFENGTAKNILGEDGLIGWETFSQVTERNNELYYSLDRE